MKNKILSVLLYISSFVPLYFLVIVKELIEIINGNLSFNITNSIMLSINFLLIILGSLGIYLNINNKDYEKVELLDCKNITRENFLPYFPLFVLFALAFELEFISMAVVYIMIIVMVGIVYIKNDMFYINPFMNIMGFSIYDIKYVKNGEEISKKIFSLCAPKKGEIKINYFYIKK